MKQIRLDKDFVFKVKKIGINREVKQSLVNQELSNGLRCLDRENI
jgi:hypothetical protein